MGALDGTPWFEHDADRTHPAASTLKLALLVAVYRGVERGDVTLDDQVLVHATFASAVRGESYETTPEYDNDPQPWQLVGGPAPLGWLAGRAIVSSSNLATNLLIERLGLDAVNEVYDAAGARHARLRRGIQDGPAGEHGLWNTATAADMAAVLRGALDGRLVGAPSATAIEATLAACEHDDAIPAGLPESVYIAHKPGWIEDACHDVALVRPDAEPPFILSVFTSATLDDPTIHRLVADIARACWGNRARLAVRGDRVPI